MDICIIPQPVSLQRREGQCSLSSFTLSVGEGAQEAASFVRELLGPASLSSPVQVALKLSADLARLGREGYCLEVKPQGVSLSAFAPAGLFYAVQTLRQLLPLSGERVIPCLDIEDMPRFAWRGALLDTCRHFFSVEYVLRFIDLLAMQKFNTFHWHLTDDQGWRIQIERYPRLTEIGSKRSETMAGHYDGDNSRYDGIPYGGYYTKEDIRRVVAYAQARHITIVPEIEMPGHAQAAIAAYPELGNVSTPVEVCRGWGINFDVYNVEETTIRFMQNVLDEVLELFPSPFIHIGGDEVPKKQWEENPRMQERMRELGLKDEEELQSYFVRRMDAFLYARGRRLIGWDEILEGGLAPGAAVMSWRGEEGGIAAANAGHDVVMTPNTYAYLDYYQSMDREKEPLAIGGYLPLEHVYSYEPIPASIAPEKAKHVLGSHCTLWTEYIADPSYLEYMAFPRICAIAEIGWSPAQARDYAGFLARLKGGFLPRLEAMGVNYRKLDE
jgi:hexosaminidase